MYRTTPFQNPATARTAGSCERTGATKAPVLSPAILLTGQFTPDSGGKLCFNNRHRLSSHSADKGCKLPLAGHGYLPAPICRHGLSHGQTGAVFPLSALRPAGRPKWVRASARIAGHPAAPSPTKSDRRSACPVLPSLRDIKTAPPEDPTALLRGFYLIQTEADIPVDQAASMLGSQVTRGGNTAHKTVTMQIMMMNGMTPL